MGDLTVTVSRSAECKVGAHTFSVSGSGEEKVRLPVVYIQVVCEARKTPTGRQKHRNRQRRGERHGLSRVHERRPRRRASRRPRLLERSQNRFVMESPPELARSASSPDGKFVSQTGWNLQAQFELNFLEFFYCREAATSRRSTTRAAIPASFSAAPARLDCARCRASSSPGSRSVIRHGAHRPPAPASRRVLDWSATTTASTSRSTIRSPAPRSGSPPSRSSGSPRNDPHAALADSLTRHFAHRKRRARRRCRRRLSEAGELPRDRTKACFNLPLSTGEWLSLREMLERKHPVILSSLALRLRALHRRISRAAEARWQGWGDRVSILS